MIIDGFDYGDGYTKATKRCFGIEYLSQLFREWVRCDGVDSSLLPEYRYRRP